MSQYLKVKQELGDTLGAGCQELQGINNSAGLTRNNTLFGDTLLNSLNLIVQTVWYWARF